ncbi:MAG: citrate lyase subunit alpha, partial [Paracoccaceae bacterium]
LRGLTLACSSLFPVHAPLVPLLEDGVISRIVTVYARGPVADAIMAGKLADPALLQTHGGRARAISSGQLQIDLAFIGAAVARPDGAATGRAGTLACGPLGYAYVDAAYARNSVVVAHDITTQPLPLTCIPGENVDALVQLPYPGQPEGILSGATVPSATSAAKRIGELVAAAVAASGSLRPGMSMQTGAGGYSLGAINLIGQLMAQDGICGDFLSGGITGAHVAMQQAGLFSSIRDVQCFDQVAVASSITNPMHVMMTAAEYASPLYPRPTVDALDVVILGAAEIDSDFNVNVTVGGDGRLIGGPGGHPDTAEGASLVIITTQLTGGGFAKLVNQVSCITTPGRHVDLLVTDQGIAVNSNRADLAERLRHAGLPIYDFNDLRRMAKDEAANLPISVPEIAPRLIIEDRHGGALDIA